MGPPKNSGKSRLVKYYSIWPDSWWNSISITFLLKESHLSRRPQHKWLHHLARPNCIFCVCFWGNPPWLLDSQVDELRFFRPGDSALWQSFFENGQWQILLMHEKILEDSSCFYRECYVRSIYLMLGEMSLPFYHAQNALKGLYNWQRKSKLWMLPVLALNVKQHLQNKWWWVEWSYIVVQKIWQWIPLQFRSIQLFASVLLRPSM